MKHSPSPLYLYRVHPPDRGGALATLTLRRLDVLPSADGLQLDLDADWVGSEPSPAPRWLFASADVWSRQHPTRRLGAIHLDNYDLPDLAGNGRRSVSWDWFLPPDQLEQLERDRAPHSGHALALRLRVAGLVILGDEVVGVAGETSIDLSATDWGSLLPRLGYATAPSVAVLAGHAAARHPTWREAEDRLARARQALRAGEERSALAAAFLEFERVAGRPYLAGEWEGVLNDVPGAKRKELSKLLAAHAGLISRVGRHLDSDSKTTTGERAELPLEYWEAELLVAASQLLLTFALRAKTDADTSE